MRIVPVVDQQQLDAFIRFPFSLYRNDPVWIPPLINAERNLLSAGRNPSFQTSEVVLFMAVDDADLLLNGVRKDWRKKGAAGLIFHNLMARYLNRGIRQFRINPILDFNVASLQLFNSLIEEEPYRRRRAYVKSL